MKLQRKVLDCSLEKDRIVRKHPKSRITLVAKEPAHAIGPVAMVYTEPCANSSSPSNPLGRSSTDRAFVILSPKHDEIGGGRQAVLGSQMLASMGKFALFGAAILRNSLSFLLVPTPRLKESLAFGVVKKMLAIAYVVKASTLCNGLLVSQVLKFVPFSNGVLVLKAIKPLASKNYRSVFEVVSVAGFGKSAWRSRSFHSGIMSANGINYK